MGRLCGVADEELVVWALLGELPAYDELVRRYRGALVRVARQHLECHELAEDVAQEALLQGFRALPQLREPASFGAWLCAIAHRKARRMAQGLSRQEPVLASELDQLLLDRSPELSRRPEEEAIRSCEVALLRTLLERLPPDNRIVLELRYLDDWPMQQVAGFLSIPLTTAKWRLHYGLKLLRRRLGS
ncbi:MAG TPA: sigma-70 family RNA polymerase sigma factor [Armatimonadota bacterium]